MSPTSWLAGCWFSHSILVQLFFHHPQGFVDGDLGEKAGNVEAY